MVESVGRVGVRAGSRIVIGDAGQAKCVACRSNRLTSATNRCSTSSILSFHNSTKRLLALFF